MKRPALVVPAIVILAGCGTVPEPVEAGYRGIGKAVLMAKGME